MVITEFSSRIRRRKRCANTANWSEEGARDGGAVGLRETKSTTRDGRHIVLSANIELPSECSVAGNGAEGIGLYRTEFLYINRTDMPSEEEQYEDYRKVAESVGPHPLIIRTFDLGGDKIAEARRGR